MKDNKDVTIRDFEINTWKMLKIESMKEDLNISQFIKKIFKYYINNKTSNNKAA